MSAKNEKTEPESPTQEPQGETATNSPPSAEMAARQLTELFSTLVPPKTIQIEDAFGNTHMLRGSLPARAQIMVIQQLQAIWDTEVDRTALSGLSGVDGIGPMLIRLATDESILDSICSSFEVAHKKAVKAARESGIAEGYSEDEVSHVADLFPVEEIVAGLVPFFIRLASRTAKIVDQVMPSRNQ